MAQEETAYEKRIRLKEDGKIELPLNVDTKKYLLSAISFRSLLLSLPLFFVGIIILFVFYKTSGLSAQKIILCMSPWAVLLACLSITHPDRKNITLWDYRITWRIKFNQRPKLFVYQKGDVMSKKKKEKTPDIRSQLGINNIHSDCYETIDHRFVKVISVSSINLSLLSQKEVNTIFEHYESFLNDLPKEVFPLQVSQIAQPVNLKKYRNDIRAKTENETDPVKNMLRKGYLDFTDNIEKSKKMVSQNRYLIFSKSFSTVGREKALAELDRLANLLVSSLTTMLDKRFKLNAKVLNNDELFQLLYTCIDYENAQVNNLSFLNAIESPVTLGEKTYKEVMNNWEIKQREHIV